ncbi:MAG: 3-deoxy-manno-octulosonate cytidylyltransferase [Chlamydiota bacterium]
MPKNNIVGVIPARLQSKRFPRKMLVDINGKPLIQHTYENALSSKKLDTLVIATESKEIYDCAKQFGANVVMTSFDCLSGTDRVAEAIENNPEFAHTKIVVNIQGDEPNLASSTIDSVVQALEDDENAEVSTACVKIDSAKDLHNASVVKCTINLNGQALYFSRAMIPHGKTGEFKSELVYYKHFGIYCFRKDFLLKYGSLPSTPLQLAEDLEQLKILEHGYHIHVVEVETDSIGIDTPEDLKKFLQSRPNL